MAHEVWAAIDGIVHLAAGRLTAARAAVESLPSPEPDGATELDMMRMVILVQVAIHTDDRTLLQQMVSAAHDAYLSGAPMVRRTAAYVLALAAWHRNDPADAMRWLGGDMKLFGTALTPQALDQVMLARGLPRPAVMPPAARRYWAQYRGCSTRSRRSRCSPRLPNMSAR